MRLSLLKFVLLILFTLLMLAVHAPGQISTRMVEWPLPSCAEHVSFYSPADNLCLPGGGPGSTSFTVPAAGGFWFMPVALDPTGVANNSVAVNAYIAQQIASGSYAAASLPLPPGTFYAPSLSNTFGVPFTGSGVILKSVNQFATNRLTLPVTATKAQQSSYAYTAPRLVFGMEYASHWMANVEASTATTVRFSGDSTTSGVNVTTPFQVDQMFLTSATQAGITGLTVANAGHSGADTTDWISTYLPIDQATNPDVYVVRWGINDQYFGIPAATTIANIRSGLATIRASKTVDQETVVLEMPSSTNDSPNGRDRGFYEQLRNGFAQAARDYQAVFIDLYALMPDNDFSEQTCMMDLPYSGSGVSTPPIHIHPGNCKNPIYNDILARTLIDPLKVVLPGSTAVLGPLFNVPLPSTAPAFAHDGVFMGLAASGGGTQVFSNQAAPLNSKYWQWYEDGSGNLNLVLVNDAISASNLALQMTRTGINFTGLRYIGNAPCFAFRDNAGSVDSFFGAFVNVAQFGVNRNPCTGGFTDVTKTAATLQMNATAGGTTSNAQFYFSATANGLPVLASTFDNTGMNIPTGETYKINGVPISGSGTRNWSCQPGYGDGTAAIAAGTKLMSTCFNDTGASINITSIGCFSDNSGTSTMAAANTTATLLSSSPLTCTPAFANGTPAAGNHTLINGDYIRFTTVADGVSKQINFDVGGTY